MKSALPLLLACSTLAPLSFGQVTLNPTPTRVLGQVGTQITNLNPNLVEGREFFSPQGVVLDKTTNPPGLYVSDTGNNRVLGFRSAVGFANGAKADIVLGQPDFATTPPQGPGRTARTTGFASPTGLAVDASGNLYVVDSGNNRVLRFPKPFGQSGDQIPDFVIGQQAFSTNAPNQGGISASTLALSSTSGTTVTILVAFISFDSSGNLWVADAGNNRVLRFNASALGSQATPGPAADLVLGQQDFLSGGVAAGFTATTLSTLVTPTGIAFDSGGRLFISESNNSLRSRILVWNPPFRSGQFASRIIGVDTDVPQPPAISQFQLNAGTGSLFSVGNQIGIADSGNNRLLLYPPFDQWTSDPNNQAAVLVIGQPDFNSGMTNQALPGATAGTLAHPTSAVYSGTELFVVDSSNHRLVVLPGTAAGFAGATRVLGQDALTLNSPNLVEGREFDFSAGADAGVAVDLNANPPRLYVADTYNHRVLGYKDLRNLQNGGKADIVIGQPDFQQTRVNYPSNNANQLNASGLFGPAGLYVDPDGNLYVADTGNGRVLRFPKPFDNYKAGAMESADLVLGQVNFFTKIQDATSRTMAAPYGIAQASEHGLLVSDRVHNRVLYFPGTSKSFTSGETATLVFGQKDFSSSGTGSNFDQMNSPHHIATDVDDHLYVADTGNGRVLIFDHAPTSSPDPFAIALTTNLSQPRGVYVSPITNEIWVADAGANAAIRFPPFNSLIANNYAPNATLQEAVPLALAQDAWGNIFIADDANRVVIHFPGLSALNAANYLRQNVMAPGMISALYSTGNSKQFGTGSQTSSSLPLPRTLNGIQVLFNGSPAPLFYAGSDQINFQVPSATPTSGAASIQVLEVATGRILGDTTVAMTPVNPGLFTQAGNGIGAAIAVNKDNTLNTQTNPAVAGDIITVYGTGQGVIPGGPADGDVIHTALPSPRPPTVIIANHSLTGGDVAYAGVAPGQVGVWQVNVKIPGDVITLPNSSTQIIVLQDSVPSGGGGLGRAVIIYVKQP